MTCVHPSRIKNPAWGQPNEPYSFEVPCGRCMNCRIEKTREWATRLTLEMPYHDRTGFLTLTYDDEHLTDGLVKKELQDFFKRLRKNLSYHTDTKIKYFAVGEYGDDYGRPHFHSALFGLGVEDYDLVAKSWDKGFIELTNLLPGRINYLTGYLTKKLYGDMAKKEYGEKQPPFQLISKGLGKNYVLDNEKYLKQNWNMNVKGVKQELPRYFKKVLGMPKTEIQRRAQEKLAKMQEEYLKRGLIEEVDQLERKYLVNKQKELETKARISLKQSKL